MNWKSFFTRLVKNPKTTIPAVATITVSAIAIAHNPATVLTALTDPNAANMGPLAGLLGGIGVLFAADDTVVESGVKRTAQVAPAPAPTPGEPPTTGAGSDTSIR